MNEIGIIGLDLAKQVFQVHGASPDGRVVLRKKLGRGRMLEFFAKLPSCIVAMEACASAHYWGREIGKLGHEVRLINPSYVKPFVSARRTMPPMLKPSPKLPPVRPCASSRSRALKSRPPR
ncbi:transposase (plasmid) [Sinorhizobium americanum CCGM7]|nr:transposase [Sinorhizobium americanum CCGM7]